MATVQDLISRIQALVDDPGGLNFATSDYLMPLIKQTSDEVFVKITGYDISFDEQRLVIPNVSLGTTDLSSYAASGGPLEFLFNPMRIEWRIAGQDDTHWFGVERTDNLPDQVNDQGISAWEYRSGVIYITPSTIAVDLRLRGEFLPAPIASLDAPVMNSALLTLAYKTSALIGMSRGNDKWTQLYGQLGEDTLDALERKLVKQDQSISRGFGSSRQRRQNVNQRLN